MLAEVVLIVTCRLRRAFNHRAELAMFLAERFVVVSGQDRALG